MATKRKVKKMKKNSNTITFKKSLDMKAFKSNIVRVATGFQQLTSTGLNENAIVTLVHDSTKVKKSVIKQVINGVSSLSNDFLSQPRTSLKKRKVITKPVASSVEAESSETIN